MIFKTGLPVCLLTHHVDIPSTIPRWQFLAFIPAHPVSYPQWPSAHIPSTISFGSQGSSCLWENKSSEAFWMHHCFQFSRADFRDAAENNKTKSHPCHHPQRLKPEDQACGLAGRKSQWSLDSLYRYLCCFLAGVSVGGVRGAKKSWQVSHTRQTFKEEFSQRH